MEKETVLIPVPENDSDISGGYTSTDGRSLCYVKEEEVYVFRTIDDILDFVEEWQEAHRVKCDVEGCDNQPGNGGSCWRDTGYWMVCHKHSAEYHEGCPQPQMKQSAIDRENSRDKVTGCLPIGSL